MEQRFWWVNQNQTYEHEVKGQYLWSPKHRSDGTRNPFYEFMREVAPADMIFSFMDAKIKAVGFVKSYAYECPKPTEFGATGKNWNQIGWKVDVSYQELQNPIRPKDKIAYLNLFLPDKYSPLQKNGNGIQNVYLTSVPNNLASALINLMDNGIQKALRESPGMIVGQSITEKRPDVVEWEDHIEKEIKGRGDLKETEKLSLVNARRGQGLFKERVKLIENHCRITKVDNKIHLIASHIKPWRDGENRERLDGENGLLLTPSIDHLFDAGFISFENNGELIVSPRADKVSLKKMGVPVDEVHKVGVFTEGQKNYLSYHREEIFLRVS